MKYPVFGVVAMFAISASAVDVVHDKTSLTVRDGRFSRTFVATKDGLKTASMKLGDKEYVDVARAAKADASLAVEVSKARWSVTGETGTKVVATTPAGVETLWLFDGVPGVLRESGKIDAGKPPELRKDRVYNWPLAAHFMKGADSLPLSGHHYNITAYEILDRTDLRSEQVSERNVLLMGRELPLIMFNQVVAVQDVFDDSGIAALRIAPVPADRPEVVPDFVCRSSPGGYAKFNALEVVFASVRNGYPVAELVYDGGEIGRQKALRDIQRALRRYVPGRDGIFLTNTWGDGNRDARICDSFVRAEIAAGAELGVDVIQIDDGWQLGKSANSAMITNRGDGAWGDFLAKNGDFWKPDPTRFPVGLKPLVDLAEAKGMRFGLWYGPSSSDDCAAWQTDAANIFGFYNDYGIEYFKIDGLNLSSALAISRQRELFDTLLRKSGGRMVFDFDVTGDEPRLGYFGTIALGPIFLENRSFKTGFYPYQTLRSAWSLSKVIDPVRLRVEFINPEHARGYYPETPLSPEHYRADTLFAAVMMCSPLGWFEISELSPKSVAELKPIVARWKSERENMHGGFTMPVGNRPDGVVWTGFANRGADGVSDYALLFREMNPSKTYSLDLKRYGLADGSAELIGGRGAAEISPDGALRVTVPEVRDFVWVRLAKRTQRR